ncbi:hypothetical protein IFM89_022286 [Coptis chinensis]|uniref:CRM domain-containing protein n=1 Tax=Coptis chinensis TaxID=261450 RepID=A0A835IE15_9MAGN|nr:hypothetical protein IFM89_022286 [Coptis chinensis]
MSPSTSVFVPLSSVPAAATSSSSTPTHDSQTHLNSSSVLTSPKSTSSTHATPVGVAAPLVDFDHASTREKTGGKIIYSRGGALFLFRGRNYNYRNRPRFPLMLWKPVTPVYPLLIQQVPEGLTLEEAREMRKRGRELQAICKLGKNGVYSGLVEHVKEAFEECELVRVDCQGMNGSDYKKIGAKLKDLVPCVLVSFEFEHILMWRGWDWKSSFLKSKDDCMEDRESATDGAIVNHTVADASIVANEETTELIAQDSLTDDATLETRNASSSSLYSEGVINRNLGLSSSESEVQYFSATSKDSFVKDACESFTMPDSIRSYDALVPTVDKRATKNDSVHSSDYESEPTTSSAPKHSAGLAPASDGIAHDEGSESLTKIARLCSTCTDEVVVLMKKAVEIGSAVILDDASLDADIVFKRSVAFSKAAPPGPVFRNSVKKVLVQKRVKHESSDLEEDVTNVTEKTTVKKSFMNQRIKDFKEVRLDTLPYGSLGVDELAKLLG